MAIETVTHFTSVELFRDVVAPLSTLSFTAWLAYWTWRRDQERLSVQKIIPQMMDVDGKKVWIDAGHGVLVRNLSLFSVRIRAVGFVLPDKSVYQLVDPTTEQAVPAKHASLFSNPGRVQVSIIWPVEIPSHGRQAFYLGAQDAGQDAICDTRTMDEPEVYCCRRD